MKPISSLDDAREQQPDLGFALYAIEPGGPVTLEIFDPEGRVFRFDGASETAVLAAAFPPDWKPDIPEPTPSEMTDDIFS